MVTFMMVWNVQAMEVFQTEVLMTMGVTGSFALVDSVPFTRPYAPVLRMETLMTLNWIFVMHGEALVGGQRGQSKSK